MNNNQPTKCGYTLKVCLCCNERSRMWEKIADVLNEHTVHKFRVNK